MNELALKLAETIPPHSGAGPDWVGNLRAAGVEQFRQHGLTTHKDEAWKYTRLGVLEKAGLQLASTTGAPKKPASRPEPLIDAQTRVDMLDGQMLEQFGELPKGLSVLSLADALNDDIPGLQELLESLPEARTGGSSSHGFSALNTATLDSGIVIHVAAGTDAGRLLISWISGVHASPSLVNTRVCVIMEEEAKLELIEQFENPVANACNSVFQIHLGNGSSLQHIRFQHESEETVLITRTEVSQQSASEYAYYGFDLGGGLVRHDLHCTLSGEAAKAGLYGAYLLDGSRHVDNHARVDHVAPGGVSNQYFRGVAGGSGRAVFNTAVYVHPGADETEAMQSNANILLSARAEVDTKPELEIYADEVVASHGATVGQLDEQAVFYLRTRGLSEHDARQMLTTAFCRSVSDKLADPVLGELISERMMDVMPKAE